MRFPPWVKKKSLSHAVVTKPVLLGEKNRDKERNVIVVKPLTAGYKDLSINWDYGAHVEGDRFHLSPAYVSTLTG